MEHIIEPGTTPSIPLKTSELIVHYAKRVPCVQSENESWLVNSADTTGWCQTFKKIKGQSTETIFLEEGTSMSAPTGISSLLRHAQKDKLFPVIIDIAMPLNRHMTTLITELALHNAMTSRGEILLTGTVPGIALKGALYFAETSTVRGRDSRVSTPLDVDVIAGVPLSDEVSAFASIHGLRSYLADTFNLVRRSFSSASPLQIEYEHDDETEREWLAVTVRVSGEIDAALEQYDVYTRQFMRLVPWPARRLIRLNYDIV